MESKIRILSEELVSKIAAGEVVERPASVIKELVENSIDAGADNIDIEIGSAGRSLIRVADNGEGMTESDARLACRQHATSKLRHIEDLGSIYTLGFRGEALASITSVSQTDIITKSDVSGTGVYLYLESGQILKTKPVGRARGTTVEVRNLFYNVPARKKFLKKKSTELAEIVKTTGHFILSRPDIEFKLSHDGKCILRADKGMNLKERIKLILGEDAADNMFAVSGKNSEYEITGFVSRPSWTKKDRRAQLFFINKRFVKSKSMSDALNRSFWSMLERGRFPLAVLFIEVPPDSVDINVHPAKLLVKFEDETIVRDLIRNTLKEGFAAIKPDKTYISPESREEKLYPGPETPGNKVLDPGSHDPQKEFKYGTGKGPVKYDAKPERESLWPVASGIKRHSHESIFQFADCYIVRIENNVIKVTDQHAAHERILYESFSTALKNGEVETQNMLFPVRLDLSATEKIIMETIIADFQRIGFHIEEFGENAFIVQAVPAIIGDADIKTVIMDVFDDLKECDLSKTNIVDELVKRTACRAAVKSGDPLTKEEMLSLLEQLSDCSLPFTCPHGRPTVLNISVNELEKRFHRK